MTADAYESVLGLLQMGTGNDNNSWGTNANAAYANAAMAIAGVNTISTTGGTTDLSTVAPPTGLRLDLAHIQIISGTITSDVTIKIPNVSKRTMFINNTVGSFNCFVQVPGGTSPAGLKQIPQGHKVDIVCDGSGNLYRGDSDQIGRLIHHGGTSAPGGALTCNGASLLRAEYPDLFNVIGTIWGSVDSTHFTLPLLTDTNRYLRAADGTNVTVGQYQASQNKSHTHTASGTTGTESATHTHTQQGTFTSGGMSANDPHTHTYITPTPNFAGGAGGAQSPATTGATTGATSIAHTHNVTISGATSTESATHTHSFSVTTGTGSADGTDARPESAGVLICIRY